MRRSTRALASRLLRTSYSSVDQFATACSNSPLLAPALNTSSICFEANQSRSINKSFAAAPYSTQNGDNNDNDGVSLTDAFQKLIDAAFELVDQGRPVEAEHILLEGAKEFEKAFGEHAIVTTPLYDQASLISFMHDRNEEARDAAKRSFELLNEFVQQSSKDPETLGAAATAGARYGSTLVATGQSSDAQPVLQAAVDTLSQVIPTVDDDDILEKFHVSLGESKFYLALSHLASLNIQELDIAAIKDLDPQFKESLSLMIHHIGQHPLVGCALREHHKAVVAALEMGRKDVAEALLTQQIDLFQLMNPRGEQLPMLLYEKGTLLYVLGRYEDAAKALEKATQLTSELEGAEEHHLITVKHRLGLVLGALGDYKKSKELLHEIAPDLVQLLGPANPVSSELNLMLAYMQLKQGDGDKAALCEEMHTNLKALEEYGEDHMLVVKAKEQYKEVCG